MLLGPGGRTASRSQSRVVGFLAGNSFLAGVGGGFGVHELVEADIEFEAEPANRVDVSLFRLWTNVLDQHLLDSVSG